MTPSLSDMDALAELLPLMTDEERAKFDKLLPTPTPSFVDPKFPHQAAFVTDPARFKAVIGPRRMGKSSSLVRVIMHRSWAAPHGMSLYIGLTLAAVKKAVWDGPGGFKRLDGEMKLDLKFNEGDSVITLPNGHKIFIIGMDSKRGLRDLVRGGAYVTIVVDEAATFNLTLDGIFSDVLRAAVADSLGVIILAGTPGFVKIGLFYRLTNKNNEAVAARWTITDADAASEWSVHRWTGASNPGMRQQLEIEVASMLAANPLVQSLPWFRREQRGLWVLDDTKLCYRYAPERNDYTVLPILPAGQWHHLLVCDMGYRPDPLAMTIQSWNDMDPDKTLYVQSAMEELGLLNSDIVALVRDRERTYKFDAYVIDGAEIRAVEDMRQRSGIPWIAADKRGKSDFIEMMNSDFLLGRIKIHTENCRWEAKDSIKCASLTEELLGLVWDEKALAKGIRAEDPACAQHAVDSLLYGWRHSYVYMNRDKEVKPKWGTPEWLAAEEKALETAAVQRHRREQSQDQDMPQWPTDDF